LRIRRKRLRQAPLLSAASIGWADAAVADESGRDDARRRGNTSNWPNQSI
jgi:hypothetical protein